MSLPFLNKFNGEIVKEHKCYCKFRANYLILKNKQVALTYVFTFNWLFSQKFSLVFILHKIQSF